MEESNYSKKLLKAIKKANEKCPGETFYAFDGYFTLHEDHIAFMSDEYGDGPKGGGGIPTYSGISTEEDECLEKLLQKYGLDASDFSEKLYESFPYRHPSEIEAWEVEEEVFGIEEDWSNDGEAGSENADELQKGYLNLKAAVTAGKTKFKSMEELIDHAYRYQLDPSELYYSWEGGPIAISDNISDSFDDPFDVADEEDWLEVLNNIEEYIANPEE